MIIKKKSHCKRCGSEEPKTRDGSWYIKLFLSDGDFCSQECLEAYERGKVIKQRRK
jgi:hypothetical protein